MDYSLLLCIEKREAQSLTMDRQKTSSGAIVDLNVTEGSEKWLSPHTRHQMTFKKKNNEQINSYLNASRH